ncbi:hypothetical protein RhiirB3_447461 [Rhizophagus irregularis]|nr:hypothetical protein RhiirB3_447461 [Rhizophagus irregularis]
MVAPHVRLLQSAKYRENYIQNNLKNKTDINSPIQRIIPSFENIINEKCEKQISNHPALPLFRAIYTML